MSSQPLYRLSSWLLHQVLAINTSGEGIHSPSLFYVVRMLCKEASSYYCWREIEQRRQCMLRAPKLLHVRDFGSVGRGQYVDRLVSDIARTSLESPRVGQFFFRLLVYLGEQHQRALNIVELGTNLGITTSYLALAHGRNRVQTFEGSEALIEMAQLNWNKLDIHNIEVVEGNIDDTLYTHARERVDFAFMDANHLYEPTWRYFDYLASLAHEKTIMAVDDIHSSPQMYEVWKQIQQDKRVTTTMDFFYFGLIFFDTHYMKRHYRLRL